MAIFYMVLTPKLFKTKEELFNNFINKTVRKGGYIHTVPIKGDNGKIEGAVILFYQVKITFANIRGDLYLQLL